MSANSSKEQLVDNLRQQLSEIDLIQAMYPNPGDIILSEKNIEEINNFIESKSEYIPDNLDFVINLHENGLKLELFIDLPLSYPTEEPDILVRCNKLNRHQETDLNTELSDFIKTNHVGEVSLHTAITWLQENIETYASHQNVATAQILLNDDNKSKEEKFTRVWIYSHHIYNKKKREEIQKLAKALHLTGFCLSGKPGVICIEGDESACNEWWRDIKSMCWKKIMIRKTETFETNDESKERRFHNFEELNFKAATHKHSNLSEFSKYMMHHGFSQMFNDFFGFCNE